MAPPAEVALTTISTGILSGGGVNAAIVTTTRRVKPPSGPAATRFAVTSAGWPSVACIRSSALQALITARNATRLATMRRPAMPDSPAQSCRHKGKLRRPRVHNPGIARTLVRHGLDQEVEHGIDHAPHGLG